MYAKTKTKTKHACLTFPVFTRQLLSEGPGGGKKQERILNPGSRKECRKCPGNLRFPCSCQCSAAHIQPWASFPLAARLISASQSWAHQPGVSLDVGQASWEWRRAEIGTERLTSLHVGMRPPFSPTFLSFRFSSRHWEAVFLPSPL